MKYLYFMNIIYKDIKKAIDNKKVNRGKGYSSAGGDAYSIDQVIFPTEDISPEAKNILIEIIKLSGNTVIHASNLYIEITDRCGQTRDAIKAIDDSFVNNIDKLYTEYLIKNITEVKDKVKKLDTNL